MKATNKSGMKLIHISGLIGVFVRNVENRYGTATVIKLENGQEYFAPKNEFKTDLR